MKKIKKLSICLSSLPLLFNTSCISGIGPQNEKTNQEFVYDSKGNKVPGILDIFVCKKIDVNFMIGHEENASIGDAVSTFGTRLPIQWGEPILKKIKTSNDEEERIIYEVNVTKYIKKESESSDKNTYFFQEKIDNTNLMEDYQLSFVFNSSKLSGKSINYQIKNSDIKMITYCSFASNYEAGNDFFYSSFDISTSLNSLSKDKYYSAFSLFDFVDGNLNFPGSKRTEDGDWNYYIAISIPKNEDFKIIVDKTA